MVESAEVEEVKSPGQEDEGEEISEVYKDNAANEIFTTEHSRKFTVSNPHDHHGHIVYDVVGIDDKGRFEVPRRYNDFHCLHEQLAKRWPGIIVPELPKKSSFSAISAKGKDEAYLAERRFFLERFMRQLSAWDFVINGEECQIFFRTQHGDVGKQLSKLPALTSQQIYERLTSGLQIGTDDYDEGQVAKADRVITDF